MILELLRHPDGPRDVDIHLIAGVPYATDLMYRDLFEELATAHPRFHYHPVISRPDAGPRRYVEDYLREATGPLQTLLRRDRCLLYV